MIRRNRAPPAKDETDAYASLIETVTVIVISAAGLMASWASHQGAMWNGMQSVHFSRANVERGNAANAKLEGDLIRAVEVDLFSDWIEAKTRRNEVLAEFYRKRMPGTFRGSFEAWLATRPLVNPQAPSTPFVMSSYHPPEFAAAKRAEKAADAEFALGEQANRTAYDYNRAGVVLATAMFFGGVGQVFRHRMLRITLAAVAIVTWLIGLQLILAIPAVSLHPFSYPAGGAPPPAYVARP